MSPGNLQKKEEVAPQTQSRKRPEGFSRRDFLKLMGASSVLATAACRRPVEQIVPSVIRAPETQPGIPAFYSTVTPEGSGAIVRVREGRPIKIAGNPDHPLSQGGLTASETASLMDLYDPDRQRRAATIDPKTGKRSYRKEEAIVLIAQSHLKKGNYLLVTDPLRGSSSRELVQAFLQKYPRGRHVEFRPDPTLRQIAEGQKISYGKSLVPSYRFDKADFILSIDGDFLGSMPLASVYTNTYSKKRELRQKSKTGMSRLVVFESMYTTTGSNADERYAIRPGDQTLIGLTLAAHISINLAKGPYTSNPQVSKLLKGYLPNKISTALRHEKGIYRKSHFERLISRLAQELWENRGKSLVLGGSPLAANGNNSSAQVSFNLLNTILGNDGKTVDYKREVLLSTGAKDKEIQGIISDMASGKINTLVFSDANLLYHLSPSLEVEDALRKGPRYILSLDDRITETGRLAHAILPKSHFLESWGESQLLNDLSSIQQPVIRPLYQTRSFEDRLIQLSGGELNGYKSFYDFLRSRWRSKTRAPVTSFRKSWTSWLQAGYVTGKKNLFGKLSASSRKFLLKSIEVLPFFSEDIWNKTSKVEKNMLYLGLYYGTQVGDGSHANNAYRQELPDPVTKIVWDNYLCLLPETARELGLKQGSLVEVGIDAEQRIEVPVHLQPGIHPQAALLALGYGRSSAGKVANRVGKNASHLIKAGSDSFSFSGMLSEIRNTGKSYEIASTQDIYRHSTANEEKAFFTPQGVHEVPYRSSSQHDRPIVRETTYKEFQSGKFTLKPDAIKYPKKQELEKGWKYEGTRWHMTIDLNACTGCGACVTSCNTENNIPMVGKDEVKVGREMHWLRIDRYFSGEEKEPEVSHQPMLCQHCENAPCENVCPVAATTHNNEGLNVMTYNRCIGTRYCANNCPYKVRRFNWFENWNFWEGAKTKIQEPQQLALNPDVTVRGRGVMEKCTFCVQRISTARQEVRAKANRNDLNGQEKGGKDPIVPDGIVRTACQEVCPTHAISFGNILDPKSEVSQLNKSETRNYQVLDFLGVKPQVTYLAKVRNREIKSTAVKNPTDKQNSKTKT